MGLGAAIDMHGFGGGLYAAIDMYVFARIIRGYRHVRFGSNAAHISLSSYPHAATLGFFKQ